MSVTPHIFRTRLIAAGAVLAWPLLLAAAQPAEGPNGPGNCEAGFHGGPPRPPGPPGPPMGPGFGAFDGDREFDRPAPFLMALRLSEDQQDKVFAITHAAAPALRDQMKAVRKARDELRAMVQAPQFNDGNAAALAQTEGHAESQLALLRTRLEHDVYAVLTPDQRAQVSAHERERPHPGDPSPR